MVARLAPNAASSRHSQRSRDSSARSCSRRRQPAPASQAAIRATTAANDIWNDAPVNASGATASTITADQATSRSDSAVRSSRIASKAKAAMAQERCAGTGAPASAV